MRIADIVNHLTLHLPRFVDDFTTNYQVESIERSGGVVTVTTTENTRLTEGCQVNIQGALHSLDVVVSDNNGITANITTAEPHDFTFGRGEENVAIFNNSNGEVFQLEIIGVENRNNFRVMLKSTDENDLLNDVSLLLNGVNVCLGYNGIQLVTSASGNTFTFENNDAVSDIAFGEIIAKSQPRIAGALDVNLIDAAYTEQNTDDAFLFVVVGDAVGNRSRNIDTDSTDNLQAGNFFNQRLIQTVQLFVLLPTCEQINARKARDRCVELLRPICRSILRKKFPSLIENTNNPLMITGHGTQAFNGAYYTHQYAFEATLQFGESDVFNDIDDVAFRDIHNTINTTVGNNSRTSKTNLDEQI